VQLLNYPTRTTKFLKILATTPNVILLEVPTPLQTARKGVEWVKKNSNGLAKL